jgi:hypothetical protein
MSDNPYMGQDDDPTERELTLHRFQRLITELLRGGTRRTVFQPWEVEILLDIYACGLDPRRSQAVLPRYLRAVRRQLEKSPGPPMKLSEYLSRRKA